MGEGATTSGKEMETRQRLKKVTTSLLEPSYTPSLETAFSLQENSKWQSRKPQRSIPSFILRILTIVIICLSTVGFEHWSRSRTVTAELSIFQTPITNNKIFHHNRTTPAVIALALAQKSENVDKMSVGKRPAKKAPSEVKGQKPKPSLQQQHPLPNQNLNINNYFKTAINILSMGLGAVTTPKSTRIQQPQPQDSGNSPSGQSMAVSPSPVGSHQATLNPLSVLKTQLSNSSQVNVTSHMGRSALDFEPLFEASYDNNGSTSLNNGKKLHSSFFEKLENNWDDSLAEESVLPNSFNVIEPPNLGGSVRVRPPVKMSARPNQWSASDHVPSPSSNFVNQKHVNYWPNKLNSYYGIQKPRPTYGRRPPSPSSFQKGSGQFKQGVNSGSSSEHEYDDDAEAVPSASYESEAATHDTTTIMNRVSVFYSQYKILAWVLIVAAAAVVGVGGVVGLYLNNPPTEVVTARRELMRAMNDPKILTFLRSLITTNVKTSNSRNNEHISEIRQRIQR